jgi:LacI family transcriptional regulator
MEGGKMATIYDVAKSAGVSPKTVSRVLNGDAPVGRGTRESVEKAMLDLGYVPSSAARALRSNKSGLIGVVSGAVSHTSDAPELAGLPEIFIVRGIQNVLEAKGQTMLLADTGGESRRVGRLMRTFAEHRVDGIVQIAPYHQKVSLDPVAGIPITIANGYDDAGTPAVVPDDYSGQRELVTGLIARGHRRIAYLQLPLALDAMTHRTRAYRDALAESGIAFDASIVLPADVLTSDVEVSTAALHRALETVLSVPDRPTAICCGNDKMAMAVYGLLRARGLRVPDDMSVTGYDDYRLISETLHPQLTSVELPYFAIGQTAAELLTRPVTGHTPIEIGGAVKWRASVLPHAG